MPYQDSDTFKLIIDKKDLELSIDLIKLGVIARSLGDLSYQIELIHIKDNHSIFVISRTNDEKDLPLKFEY